MLEYYKKTLINLFGQVQVLKANPIESRVLCLEIQETLVKKIMYVERQIWKLQADGDDLRNRLRNSRFPRPDKETARTMAQRIASRNQQIKEYKQLLEILRRIGDAIAFTYIDKWDIKPMAYKDSPGFISGKKGLRKELGIMRSAFAKGLTVVLNDITNCLRYGDLTVVQGRHFRIFEVKSSRHRDKRVARQMDNLEKLLNYLRTDHTSDLYDMKGDYVRIDLAKEEVNYREQLNRVINEALTQGVCVSQVEDGLYYIAVTNDGRDKFETVLKDFNGQGKTIIPLHEFQSGYPAYYPFTLSIRDPEALYQFYTGTLFLGILVELKSISERLQRFGLRLLEGHDLDEARRIHGVPEGYDRNNENWELWISDQRVGIEDSPVWIISEQFLLRVFVEFLSLDWLVQEQAENFGNPDYWKKIAPQSN